MAAATRLKIRRKGEARKVRSDSNRDAFGSNTELDAVLLSTSMSPMINLDAINRRELDCSELLPSIA